MCFFFVVVFQHFETLTIKYFSNFTFGSNIKNDSDVFLLLQFCAMNDFTVIMSVLDIFNQIYRIVLQFLFVKTQKLSFRVITPAS